MNPEDFVKPSGTLTTYSSIKGKYCAFTPGLLPISLPLDMELADLLGKANLELGNLNGIRSKILSPDLLLKPYMYKEAVASSRIEGTKSELDTALFAEAKGNEIPKGDEQEVKNYIEAMDQGLRLVKTQDFNLELILALHKTLLSNARGANKRSGEIRTTQNFIGTTNSMVDARYVPPPENSIIPLLTNLFEYINNDADGIPPLIKIGIAHYQFEAIHPFLDGNGRIGRLLITIFLIKKKILELPLLYISGYFEKYKDKYDDLLLKVSKESDYTDWLKFFLNAIITQSLDAKEREAELIAYFNDQQDKIKNKKNIKSLNIFESIFENPYITITNEAKRLKINYNTAKSAIDVLVELGILEEITGQKKNKVFFAMKILEIVND